MIDLRRMAFACVREVNFLHGILHGISAARDAVSSLVSDSKLLADFPKEDAATG